MVGDPNEMSKCSRIFHKTLSKAKINFCNADANADADVEMLIPRFPNGHYNTLCEMFVYKHTETIEYVKK